MSTSLFDPSNNPAGALVDPNALGSTLRQAAASAASAGSMPFLKLRKGDGKWEFGAESSEVSDTDEWAVNFNSFKIGMIGWKGGQVVGEQMFPIAHAEKIDPNTLETIESNNPSDGWKDQVSVEMKRISDSTEVLYKATSYGGKQMLAALMGVIGAQLESNPSSPIAVVRLSNDSYKHSQYGQVFNPAFEVVRWLNADGKEVSPPEPKPLV